MTSENRISSEQLPQKMTLHDNFVPGIGAGAYRLAVQQTVSFGSESHHYYRDQRFVVAGPRYLLPEDEIHARYPPEGGVGDYGTTLPHLVLRKRALPWERNVWSPQKMPAPWLALLLLSQSEIDQATQTLNLDTSTPNPLLTRTTPRDLYSAGGTEGHALLPLLKAEEDESDDQTSVRLLNLPLALFRKIIPTKAELPYLAHLRCVDPSDKVPLNMHAVGDFAVLVGNRLPPVGTNVAFLVSLEGVAEVIDGSRHLSEDDASVRLVTLASWSFNNDAAGIHTFGERMHALDAAPLSVDASSPAEPTKAGDHVSRALANGYAPIRYRPYREPETFGWYRGPFTPRPVARLASDIPLFYHADAALILDTETGLYDFSYAAAFQLGRLHMLSTPSAAQALRRFLDAKHDAFAVAQAVEQFLEKPWVQAALEERWLRAVEIYADELAQIDDPQERAARLQNLKEEEMLPPAALDALAQKINANEQTPPPTELNQVQAADRLLHFLAELALLYPLPYEYLIAHPKLLPPESMRFFYIDDNYIDALIEGALSVVQDCRRDRQIMVTSRRELDEAIAKIIYQYRRLRQGLTQEADPLPTPNSGYLDGRKSGFLLRSTLVSDWPGVEIACYSERGQKIPLLRLDHIGDDLLLCLATEIIYRVEIKEPDEGLRFGIDDEGNILLRHLTSGPVGQPIRSEGKEIEVAGLVQREDSAAGVLDIARLQQTISDALAQHEPNQPMGPAAFALQLLRSPEKQPFDVYGPVGIDSIRE